MKLTCPKCAAKFQIANVVGGAQVVCPKCSAMLTIPGQSLQPFQFQDKSGAARRKGAASSRSVPQPGGAQASSFNKLVTGVGALAALAVIGLAAGILVDDSSLAGENDRTDVQIAAGPNNSTPGSGKDAVKGGANQQDINDKTASKDGAQSEIPPFEPFPPFTGTTNDAGTDGDKDNATGGIKLPSGGGGGINLPSGGDKKGQTTGATGGKQQKGKTTGAPGGKKGGALTVNFLGAKGKGKRFAIVADNSGSMIAGKIYWDYQRNIWLKAKQTSMQYLQDKLISTLHKFENEAQFFVVFYSDDAKPQPHPGWVRKKKDVKDLVDWVRKIKPQGKTKPLNALKMAFNMKPKPDVIFFMSDGIIPKDTYKHILQLNPMVSGKRAVTVHTIQFNVPGTDRASQMAAENINEKGVIDPNYMRAIKLYISSYKASELPELIQNQRYQFGQMNYIAKQCGGTFIPLTVLK